MFDWLGLSPTITMVIGIALIAIGASILIFLGLYLFEKYKSSSVPTPKKQPVKQKIKEGKKDVAQVEEPAQVETKIAENKEEQQPAQEKTEKKPAVVKKKQQSKKKTTNTKSATTKKKTTTAKKK